MKSYDNIFDQITSLENLFTAWDEFKSDKLKKKDALAFEWSLENNILELHRDLKYHKYRHGVYTAFTITDPKQRKIHKAIVLDRILHHAIFRVLNPLFEPTFISNSFSCRVRKGSHKGINTLAGALNTVSKNHRKPCFALKCDIKKFFDSVDHQILLDMIKYKIKDLDLHCLIKGIIGSFWIPDQVRNDTQLDLFGRSLHPRLECRGVEMTPIRERENKNTSQRGIPIGNLTSQLFANIYMNEFDQFVKHKLKIQHYCRYTDDFVIVSDNRSYLENLLPEIQSFLSDKLKLELHPNKVSICKIRRGIDFLGYVILPHYRRLRTKTKNRIFKKLKLRVVEYKAGLISEETLRQSLNSFLGVLSHSNSHELRQELLNQFWF